MSAPALPLPSALPCTTRLSVEESARLAAPIEQARGLPTRTYTSAEWLAHEREQVVAPGWACLGFANELAPRQARPVDFMGIPLMMVRDGEGVTRVFHNVCRHRGLRLVNDTCDLRGGIRCPYHSWIYGFDGDLRATPHVGGPGVHTVSGFEPGDKSLYGVRTHVWLDMVFVNLSGDAPDFDAYLAPLRARWAPLVGERGLESVRAAADARVRLELAANWKLLVENYCESYHLPTIHPALNRYSRLEDHYSITEGSIGAGQGSLTFDFTSRLGANFTKFRGWPQPREKVAEYIALYPNVLLGLQVDHFYAVVLCPEAPDRTVETLQLYFLGDQATDPRLAESRAAVRDGWQQVFLEDVGVCEGMQAGRASPAFDGGVFSPAMETATHHFHQWVARRAAMREHDAPTAVNTQDPRQ